MADLPAVEAIKNGSLPDKQTIFFMCDIQEKFRNVALYFNEMITSANKLVETSRILGIPLVVTEQYPKALGHTVNELNIGHAEVFSKTKFSMMIPEVIDSMQRHCNGEAKCVVLFGLEAHICIEQTAIDLRSSGYQVHVVADATVSRSQEDRLLAFERLKQIGCFITTTESVLFKFMMDKNHPKFNEIRPLVKSTTPFTGLSSKM
ncbi:hypothetical protein J437_LFUL009104 [Ladona fulva]|uniref:Isochorismatase domain-containing protein 1 n=1 Tax=Ladona fulva TaxID=123851 RepID=A0A8K0P0T4_LADFU|nr:hypothetical protein J437_LFUL009104 [Ladona fulva]